LNQESFSPLVPERRVSGGGIGDSGGLRVPGLFALDLGPPEVLAPAAPAAEPEPEPDPLPALLEVARLEGMEAGRRAALREATASAEAEAARALSEIARGMRDATAAAAAVAEESATATARLALACLAAVLPTAAERVGEAEVARFAAALLPALGEEPRLELRVAPALRPAIAAHFAQQPRVEVQEDAAIRRGDAALRWRTGIAERNAAAMQDAVLQLLAGLGLADPPASMNEERGA
jgi:flagellar biosynthesis/type III secretory pathway protein FliH